ncbi:MATE efflux family protein [Coemansia reversa NRRL 1564]|uniref:MATE efflux family protein n=1 Tax=Coemansia reversa (strain ATCC 12441 / NRRL 1564) TaxID=763665 RepID=A0A2G5BL92_COERN|nr:MATE efflux family protein [Coemansia reversa NRRL 1564]|eukprot:PIA19784.1 MATE efflux family protein [Coemansia reversa NRRL 1564]
MPEVVTTTEAGTIPHNTGENTPLLYVSPSQAEIEISKRDSREPYFVVALKELKWMSSSSFWTAFALLLQWCIPFINVVSVGHLGTTELGAMIISNTSVAVIAISPSIGMMGAMETFCSNAYTASRDKSMIGFHFQRGLIAVFIHIAFSIPVFLNGERLLLAIGQDPIVSQLTGQYLRIQILGLLPLLVFEACKCFLQSQEIMSAGTIVMMFVVPTHVVINYFFVKSPTFGIGFQGAAIANVISECLMLAGILIYIRHSCAMESWGGCNPKAIRNMPDFYRLALPAAVTVFASIFCCELLNIGSSYFGTAQLAATAITINGGYLVFQMSNGIGYSTSPRIGNLIGAGKPRQARIARDMSIFIVVAIGTLGMLFLTFYGQWWISVYTNDSEVVDETLKLMPVFCTFIISDGLNAVLSSILRGLGRQKLSAGSYIFSFYCVAVPLGYYVGFKQNKQALGLWWSVCVGVLLSTVVQSTFAYVWVDWKDEVRRCLIRLKRSQDENNGSQINDY